MKIATSEIEFLRDEVKNCHRIIKDLQKKREFVGLTDEEIMALPEWFPSHETAAVLPLIRAIETKLKEKNHG